MRIAHVIDYFQPKLGYQETFLAREHARSGHDVYVITSDRYHPIVYSGDAAKSVMGKRTVGAGFFIEEGIKVWRLKTLFELPPVIWLRGVVSKIQELNPDIVIVHSIGNFSALRIAYSKEKMGEFKLVYDDHMTFDNSLSKMRILYPLFKWLFTHQIQKVADALVAVIPASKVFMHERYGIPLERITVIPLGADEELFKHDAASRMEVRKELNLKEDDILFAYAGKIIPMKRLPLLIEASAKVMRNHGNVRVMLVGDGSPSYLEELKQDIKVKKLEDNFVWRAAVPNAQLYRIYSAADVVVWPWGASIGMREAIACGRPIIMSEDSKVTELVEYQNGLLFREGDASDLAGQMEKLLDSDLRKEMGRNSRKLVEDRFSWRIIAEQFIELVSR